MRREEEEKAFIWKGGRVGDGSYRQLMVVCFFWDKGGVGYLD